MVRMVRRVVVSLLCSVSMLCADGINYEQVQQATGEQQSLVPVLIVGSGVAGLSAAIYTARAHLYTVVMAGGEPGGQLMGSSLVENMPGVAAEPGYKIIERMEAQALEAGVNFLDDAVQTIERADGYFVVTTEQGRTLHALTVIITTGAFPNKLGIPGEDIFTNYGVFTCAVCDCRQATDKEVVVVGGGDSAIEAVMHLAPYARHITLLVRGDHLRASAAMQDKLKKYDHVAVHYQTQVAEIVGQAPSENKNDDENDAWMQEIVTRHSVNGEIARRSAECVFVEIGHTPNSSRFVSLIACDAQGYIQLQGRSQLTSCSGIFAAGDVTDPRYKQAGKASGDAAAAGLDAIGYLHDHGFSVAVAKECEPWYFQDVRRTSC